MYTTGDCIYFVSRFLIRNKWLHFLLIKKFVHNLIFATVLKTKGKR